MFGSELLAAISYLFCISHMYYLDQLLARMIILMLFTLPFFCRFGSLLACDTFHADVHAGNLWLLRDGRIGFLDFGRHVHI